MIYRSLLTIIVDGSYVFILSKSTDSHVKRQTNGFSKKKNKKKTIFPGKNFYFKFFMFLCRNLPSKANQLLFYLFIILLFMNIYIGNLNYSVRENDLKEVMEDYGTVLSVKIIKDRETGRSKGFAFCGEKKKAPRRPSLN